MNGRVSKTTMRLSRTILALVTALSVAMLPMAGAAISGSMAHGLAEVASQEMAIVTSDVQEALDDCCSDQTKANPCDRPSDQCPLAFCASQSGTIADITSFPFDFPIVAGNPLPIPVDQVVALHSGTPPFRPPRV
jgi:hypothetical protein